MSFAAANGFSHVVKVLLECGADHEITSFDGQKPMDIAFSNGYSMVSPYLLYFHWDVLIELSMYVFLINFSHFKCRRFVNVSSKVLVNLLL